MEKTIDFKDTVYQICTEHPEAAEILAEAGFAEITKPGMLATAGRFMSVPKGAAMKGIDFAAVRELFEKRGYRIL